MTATTNVLGILPPADRDRLLQYATEVSFPAGARLFHQGGRADRFWVLQSGSAVLDVHVPGRRAVAVDTVGRQDMLGWSWLVPPHVWQLGAEASSPVRALEFDAAAVRTLCEEDPALGRTLTLCVAQVIGHRLTSTRTRLLDLYGPYGSGLLR